MMVVKWGLRETYLKDMLRNENLNIFVSTVLSTSSHNSTIDDP